jgi:hypothetical protein
VTLITAVVNMQLLRVGLVNHTTLGLTFQKENKDFNIIIAMAIDGLECLLCLISLLFSLILKHDYKHNRFRSNRKEGAFFVQIVSEKDIVVVQSKTGFTNTKINSLSKFLVNNNLKFHGRGSKKSINSQSLNSRINSHGCISNNSANNDQNNDANDV